MKKITILVFITAFIACEKAETNEPFITDNSLFGKWVEYENYISPGTAWNWNAANNITVTLKPDLTYTSNNDNYFWGTNGSIENLTDSTFSLKSPLYNSGLKCYYKINNGVLEVWYPCIEGCGSRFKKVSNL